MDKYRIKFKKCGRSIYISHLDLQRTIQRTFMRSGYNLKYSEGFNPHPQISIALPLSVGVSSICEFLDFKLIDENVDLIEMPIKLTNNFPEGIEVIKAYKSERKANEIKWLEITGVLEYDNKEIHDLPTKLNNYFAKDEIKIIKKTKRGETEINLKEHINKINFYNDSSNIIVDMIVSAQEPTIKPELIINAMNQSDKPDFAKFRRINVYDSEMNVFE